MSPGSMAFGLTQRTLIVSGLLTVATLLTVAQSRSKTPSRKVAQPARTLSAAQWNNLGVAYMDQQRLDDAIKAFDSAHALDAKAFIPELNRSIALLNPQKMDPARQILEHLVAHDPQDASVWYKLGLLYRNGGQAEQALQAFTKASELAPNDADANY